jgi:phosphatidylglycerophosphate synthase
MGDGISAHTAAMLKLVPALLISLRFVLGPSLFALSVYGHSTVGILLLLLLAMLSDIFDGVIARRLKIATAPLRVMDSKADAWFFIWVSAAAWFSARDVVIACWLPLSIEVVLQAASYTFDLFRYGRISSLHAYSAKIWGFTLYLAFAGVLAFHTGVLVWVALVFGLISFVDATAIKVILPGWHHDVLSCFHAYRRRAVSSRQ